MPSMSYCRWHNASLAMQECANSIEEIEDGAFTEMADFEQDGLFSAIRSAARILEEMPLEYLAAAGIDLDRLPSQNAINAATPVKQRWAA